MATTISAAYLYKHRLASSQSLPHTSGDLDIPFNVPVCISGVFPSGIKLPADIPIQITITVPQMYAGFLAPSLGAIATEKSSEPIQAVSVTGSKVSQVQPTSAASSLLKADGGPQPAYPLHFLPLPKDFDLTASTSWRALCRELERWLVEVVQNPLTSEWEWGQDMFWMAYIGANPRFPHCHWPQWDFRISMEGRFIDEWINTWGAESGNSTADGYELQARQAVWAQFQHYLVSFRPTTSLAQ